MKALRLRSLLIIFSFIFFQFLSLSRAYSQVTITADETATVLANTITGPGITIISPVLTCPAVANGIFNVVSSTLGLDSGIVLTTGKASAVSGDESTLASTNNHAAGDADLDSLANTTTHDACILEFDMIPVGDTVRFRYVFGSEEYNNSTCGEYNDAFAFFISGPGILSASSTPDTENMALVPGTTIPVCVNSVNDGVPGSGSGTDISYCTSMGPGSPFTSYYIDNTGGTTITYKGFTMPFSAVHAVTPCDTYHLKLTIADGGNYLYDSGVFIEAGSLKTRSYHLDTAVGAVIDGMPHSIIKGCASANITIVSDQVSGSNQTVYYTLGGTAVNGVDYETLPDSVVLPAGDSTVNVAITGLSTSATGTKTLELYLHSPYSCAGIVDSIQVNILDGPQASIITPDTTVCEGASVLIQVTGTPGLTYNWTPSTGLDDATLMMPTATAATTTTYVMTATLPGAGCPPIVDSVTITVTSSGVEILTPDTTICDGASFTIRVTGSDSYSYSWTPVTGLSSSSIKQPVASPSTTTTYVLTASLPGVGCSATRDITVTVKPLSISIITPDTSICAGSPVHLRVSGDDSLTYVWAPAASLDNSNTKQPTATPTTNTTYVVTAGLAGTTCTATAQVTVDILSVTASAGADQAACVGTPVSLASTAGPSSLTYTYSWSGPGGFTSTLQEPTINSLSLENAGTYTVTVIGDNDSNCRANATMNVLVSDTAEKPQVEPLTLCYGGHADVLFAAGKNLLWYTSADDTVGSPIPPTPSTSQVGNFYFYVTQNTGSCASEKAVIDVNVINCCEGYVNVPTAFTPNNDGLNDKFHIQRTPNYLILEFRIYNRWGQMIFEGNNSNDSWDGTVNGSPADIGTYFYQLTVACIADGGQEIHKEGDITLIR